MTYDEIMKEIREGLTGDGETDIKYLQEQSEKYKDHELGKEISRACGRLIYNILPEEAKEAISKAMKTNQLNYDSVLEEVQFAMFKKNFDKALDLMGTLVEETDQNPMFRDDSVSTYFRFDDFFHEALYSLHNKPEKELRRSDYPYDDIYMNYGCILFEVGRYEEAHEALRKALRWNPANIHIRSEYMESLKKLNEWDEFRDMAIESFQYACSRDELGRCFRNLAFYFTEMEMYSISIALILLSMEYDAKSNNAHGELYYIKSISPDAEQASVEEMKACAEKYGFPLGPDMDVLSMAYTFGRQFEEKKMYSAAKFGYGILYDLTNDNEIKEKLDSLPDDVD